MLDVLTSPAAITAALGLWSGAAMCGAIGWRMARWAAGEPRAGTVRPPECPPESPPERPQESGHPAAGVRTAPATVRRESADGPERESGAEPGDAAGQSSAGASGAASATAAATAYVPRLFMAPQAQVDEYVDYIRREGFEGTCTGAEWADDYRRWARARSIAELPQATFLHLFAARADVVKKRGQRARETGTRQIMVTAGGSPVRPYYYTLLPRDEMPAPRTISPVRAPREGRAQAPQQRRAA